MLSIGMALAYQGLALQKRCRDRPSTCPERRPFWDSEGLAKLSHSEYIEGKGSSS
jgi:hypothetical protein